MTTPAMRVILPVSNFITEFYPGVKEFETRTSTFGMLGRASTVAEHEREGRLRLRSKAGYFLKD